jgi:hypothetical protein
MLLAEDLQCLFAVGCSNHLVADHREASFQNAADASLIINHENSFFTLGFHSAATPVLHF